MPASPNLEPRTPNPVPADSFSRSKAPPPVVWRSWPLRDEARTARFALVAVIAATVAVGTVTRDAWLTSAAAVAVALSLWRVWTPVEYHLGARGIRQTLFRRARLIRWSQIKVVEIRAHGVLLYPDKYFGPLRSMRGLYVPWRAHRDEVLRLVDFYASTVVARNDYEEQPPQEQEPPPGNLEETDEHIVIRPDEPAARAGSDDSTATDITIVRRL